MGTTTSGGRGSKGRAVSGDRPVGAGCCRREQYTMASWQPPPPPNPSNALPTTLQSPLPPVALPPAVAQVWTELRVNATRKASFYDAFVGDLTQQLLVMTFWFTYCAFFQSAKLDAMSETLPRMPRPKPQGPGGGWGGWARGVGSGGPPQPPAGSARWRLPCGGWGRNDANGRPADDETMRDSVARRRHVSSDRPPAVDCHFTSACDGVQPKRCPLSTPTLFAHPTSEAPSLSGPSAWHGTRPPGVASQAAAGLRGARVWRVRRDAPMGGGHLYAYVRRRGGEGGSPVRVSGSSVLTALSAPYPLCGRQHLPHRRFCTRR